MMAAWPAAMKPSMCDSLERDTTSMAAGTYLCTERMEKLGGRSVSAMAAVATAVVSKPEARKTTWAAGWARAMSTAWATE